MRTLIFAASCALACAPALAEGALRVCASDLTNFDDTPRIDLPAGLVFTAWGAAPGDLRQARLDPNYPPARATGQSALVLDAPATLTADMPCTAVAARALVSSRHAWRASAVAPAGNVVYQAVDTLDGDELRARNAEHPGLYDVLADNILTAAVASPIADAITIR